MGDCTSAPMASTPAGTENKERPVPTGKMTSNKKAADIELKSGLAEMNNQEKEKSNDEDVSE